MPPRSLTTCIALLFNLSHCLCFLFLSNLLGTLFFLLPFALGPLRTTSPFRFRIVRRRKASPYIRIFFPWILRAVSKRKGNIWDTTTIPAFTLPTPIRRPYHKLGRISSSAPRRTTTQRNARASSIKESARLPHKDGAPLKYNSSTSLREVSPSTFPLANNLIKADFETLARIRHHISCQSLDRIRGQTFSFLLLSAASSNRGPHLLPRHFLRALCW